MPQVDVESSCSGGVTSFHNNHQKIACETLADDNPPPSDQPDISPESFLLSAEAELDWIDRNAFIERKETAKGGGIPLHSVNINPIGSPLPPLNNPPLASTNSGSQRYSVKSKPSIIGLMKPQKAGNYAEAKNRRPASIRLFPKRSQSTSSKSGRKSGVSAAEPSSPKVSCIGRVRSKRDRSRRKKTGRQKQSEPAIARSKSQKRGFWNSFRSIFRSGGRKQPKGNNNEPVIEQPAADPPPLGVVKRFSSARRSDAWAAELEVDGAKSEPSDWPISIGTVKRFPSGRRSDAYAGDLDGDGVKSEPLDPPSIGAVKRFSSARRSDAWAADLEVDGEKSEPSNWPISIGTVKRFPSGRRSDAYAGDLDGEGVKSEPLDPPSIGGVKRFSSARRSDAWAADLEVDDGEKFKPSDPPSLGAVKRFSSGRRSVELEVEGTKSEPLDQISIFQRRIGGGL